jgi:hypothetical protein
MNLIKRSNLNESAAMPFHVYLELVTDDEMI